MSLFESASLVVTPNGTKASKLYAIKPTSGAGDLSVTRATTATRVNSAGLIESVAVNVPRLDYTNSNCPSILVEPQRTNLALRSQEFDSISWVKTNTNVTANNLTSPDGTTNADFLVPTTTNGLHTVSQFSIANVGVQTFSIFAKKGNYKNIFVWFDVHSGGIGINLDTLNVFQNTNLISHKVTQYKNGWIYISITANILAISNPTIYICDNSSTPQASFSGDGTSGVYLWGAQLEAGAYATSYIPTSSAIVTRNADVISKTGISSLIGQTEGTVFVEHIYNTETINNSGVDDIVIGFSNGTLNNLLLIIHYGSGGNSFNNKLRLYIRNAGADQALIDLASTPSGTYKVAVAYKNNDIAFYVNGVQVGVDTSASIPTLNALYLYDFLSTNTKFNTDKVKATALWKTRLTNAELAELTTL